MATMLFSQNKAQQVVRIQGIEKEAIKALGGLQKGKSKIKLFGADVLPQLFDSHDWQGKLIAPKSLPAVVVWGMLPRVSGDTETMIPASLRIVGMNPARYLAPRFTGSAMVYLTLREPAKRDFTLGVVTPQGKFIKAKLDGLDNPDYRAFFGQDSSTSAKERPSSDQAAGSSMSIQEARESQGAVPAQESAQVAHV